MAAASFKQLRNAGIVSRGDLLRAQHSDIHVEPGFNICEDAEAFESQAHALADFILEGNQIPPLLLRVAADGTLYIVDGHLRHRALAIAIEQADNEKVRESLRTVSFMPFTGNDVDRLAVVFTSREGRQLTELERALGYKRFAGMGLTPMEIAGIVNRTRQHVDQLLILANANSDVHRMVRDGKVSAAVAVGIVREHGDDAGKVLGGELTKAKAAGKAKVTAGTVKGKALPPKIVSGLVGSVDAFMQALPNNARERLAAIEFSASAGAIPLDQQVSVPVSALLALVKAHAEIDAERDKQASKARDKVAQASQADLAEAA